MGLEKIMSSPQIGLNRMFGLVNMCARLFCQQRFKGTECKSITASRHSSAPACTPAPPLPAPPPLPVLTQHSTLKKTPDKNTKTAINSSDKIHLSLLKSKRSNHMTNCVPVSFKWHLSFHGLITEQILCRISLEIQDIEYGREIFDFSTHKAMLQDQKHSHVPECGVLNNWYEF